MDIPPTHPRYESLMQREKIIEGHKNGLVADAGIIAQGRGEAFDYILGEETIEAASTAERVAAICLLLANNPVISINGNVAALAPEGVVELARAVPAKVEVNIFYRSEERMRKIIALMKEHGLEDVLGEEPDASIPGLESERAKCTHAGIYTADVVFVPLEDGDRAEALVAMGKTVICVDLNPFSRTSRTSHISIVDNLVRVLPNMIKYVNESKEIPRPALCNRIDTFSNEENLRACVREIKKGLDRFQGE
jgi:4-phosphopantoate--beta-alanine ligase